MTSNTPIRSEAEIIAAILAGGNRALPLADSSSRAERLYDGLPYMKNETDAEDIGKEAFIKAFRNLSTFRGEAKFSTWLISITL